MRRVTSTTVLTGRFGGPAHGCVLKNRLSILLIVLDSMYLAVGQLSDESHCLADVKSLCLTGQLGTQRPFATEVQFCVWILLADGRQHLDSTPRTLTLDQSSDKQQHRPVSAINSLSEPVGLNRLVSMPLATTAIGLDIPKSHTRLRSVSV